MAAFPIGRHPRDLKIAISGVSQYIENPIWIYLDDATDHRPLIKSMARLAASSKLLTQADVAKQFYFSKGAYDAYIHAELSALGLAGPPA